MNGGVVGEITVDTQLSAATVKGNNKGKARTRRMSFSGLARSTLDLIKQDTRIILLCFLTVRSSRGKDWHFCSLDLIDGSGF